MPTSQSGPADFSSYKAIRDEIAHEDNLTGTRLNWFIASQAFLLSALAIAHSGPATTPTMRNDFFFPLIPLIAVATCALIFVGIIGGAIAIRRWRRILDETARRDPSLPGIGRDRLIMLLGWAAPLLLPLVFLSAWIYLLAAGLGR